MKSRRTSKYEEARVAVDAVILCYHNELLHIYLNTRERAPFKGRKELPGGLLLPGETAEATLQRKVGETIAGFQKAQTRQFFTFTEPKRDPRVRTVTIGYIALMYLESLDSAHWHPLPLSSKLAFDHSEILERALRSIATRSVEELAPLMPQYFRLNDLHSLAELVFGRTIDNRNFRRKVVSPGIVEPTDELDRSGAHRPARLYQFNADMVG